MSSRLLLCSTVLAFLLAMPALSTAKPDNRPDIIRAFLSQGEYELAAKASRTLLEGKTLPEDTRFEVLLLLAEAEENLSERRNHAKEDTAIRAYRDLHKEFPKKFTAAKMYWKVAWLSWNHGKIDQAITALQIIIQKYANAPEAKKASLLYARHQIQEKDFTAARATLLGYFSLGSKFRGLDEDKGLVWMAVVDAAVGKSKHAYTSLKNIHATHPEMIEDESLIYATYIRLLAKYSNQQHLLQQAQNFANKHISAAQAPEIRLLLADTLMQRGQKQKAEMIYGILSKQKKDMNVRKKAFMRHLIARHMESEDEAELGKLLGILSNMAANNQLSDVEPEARLYQARIYQRLGSGKPARLDKALSLYALTAASEISGKHVDASRKEGKDLLVLRLNDLLEQEDWLETVLLWKRYPNLRPEKAGKLNFGIAQAYMHLMDFTHAEEILDKLYENSRGTVWGQRIMLGKALVWAEQGNANGIEKIMLWLSKQEQTLYRQDMLLMAARIQVGKGEIAAASQMLTKVTADDLTPEFRIDYWKTRARINLGLKHWHTAARAWEQAAELSAADEKWNNIFAQANAFIQGKDFIQAENVLLLFPDSRRNDSWHYYFALCAHHTGRRKLAEEHLTPLISGGSDNSYSIRARILLSETRLNQLKLQ